MPRIAIEGIDQARTILNINQTLGNVAQSIGEHPITVQNIRSPRFDFLNDIIALSLGCINIRVVLKWKTTDWLCVLIGN